MQKLASVLKSAGVQLSSQSVSNSNNISVVPMTAKVQQNADCWNVACCNGSC